MIQEDKKKYCDELNVICTISKVNAFNLNEIDEFARVEKWNITYNIATEHERLNNHNKMELFDLFSNQKAKMVAQEFLYKKFVQTKSEYYYALFVYLKSDGKIRVCSCPYLKSGITITPEGDICFCATHSKTIGNVRTDDIYEVYFGNEEYNEEIKEKYCKSCSHYMGQDLLTTHQQAYINEMVSPWYSYRL